MVRTKSHWNFKNRKRPSIQSSLNPRYFNSKSQSLDELYLAVARVAQKNKSRKHDNDPLFKIVFQHSPVFTRQESLSHRKISLIVVPRVCRLFVPERSSWPTRVARVVREKVTHCLKRHESRADTRWPVPNQRASSKSSHIRVTITHRSIPSPPERLLLSERAPDLLRYLPLFISFFSPSSYDGNCS